MGHDCPTLHLNLGPCQQKKMKFSLEVKIKLYKHLIRQIYSNNSTCPNLHDPTSLTRVVSKIVNMFITQYRSGRLDKLVEKLNKKLKK